MDGTTDGYRNAWMHGTTDGYTDACMNARWVDGCADPITRRVSSNRCLQILVEYLKYQKTEGVIQQNDNTYHSQGEKTVNLEAFQKQSFAKYFHFGSTLRF